MATPPTEIELMQAEEARATTPSISRSHTVSPTYHRILLFSKKRSAPDLHSAPDLLRTTEAKTVLISGGTTGIGRALVATFANQGFNVAAFSSTHENVRSTQEEFKAYSNVFIKQVDIRNQADLSVLVEEVEERFGPIQFLINNAAITGPFLPNEETSAVERKTTLEVNLHGLMSLTQIVQNSMLKAGIKNSVIVNVSSIAAKGMAGAGIYSASKAAVNTFTTCLALERQSPAHFVFAFDPGPVDTPMQAKIRLADSKKFPFVETAIQLYREGRLGNPLKTAKQIYFLMTNPTAFLAENGTVLSHTDVRQKIELKMARVTEFLVDDSFRPLQKKRRASMP